MVIALSGLALAPSANAQEAGGAGGSTDTNAGGSGGTSGGAGGTGGSSASIQVDGGGGGGGSYAAAGGAGGAGNDGTTAFAGGAGGTAGTNSNTDGSGNYYGGAGGNGGDGTGANTWGSGGGGGGGGGLSYSFDGSGGATLEFLSGTWTGGDGGNGGAGGTSAGGGGGGGGGAGGPGVLFTNGSAGGGTFVIDSGVTVTGGNGGNGGVAYTYGVGGSGGDAGIGVYAPDGGTIRNYGSITGGLGGSGATGGMGAGADGADGAGVVGSNLSVFNDGSISGGGTADAITFTGGANTLSLGTNGTLSGNIGVNGGGSLLLDQTGNDATISNVITGDGSVEIQAGSHTLTLSGTNTYSGGTTLSSGTLSLAGGSVLGSGALTAADGTTLDYASGISLANAIVVNGTLTLNQTGGSATQSGVISGSGGVTKSGTGTLILNGSNTYGGATTVNAGTLTAGADNLFSSASPTTVNSGGTLDLGGFAQTIDTVSLVGGTLKNGSLTGAISSSGGAITDIVGSPTLTTSGTGSMTALSGTDLFGDVNLNSGDTILVSGTGVAIGGNFAGGSGANVDLQDGNVGDSLSINGNASATGSNIKVDTDFGAASTDTVSIGQNASGTFNVDYNVVGTLDLKPALNIITGGDLSGATFTASGLPTSGTISLSQQATSSAVQLVSQVNPGVGGMASSMLRVGTLTDMGLNLPSSVRAGSTDACGRGGWARLAGGNFSATTSSDNGVSDLPSEVTAHYSGIQVGAELACLQTGSGGNAVVGVNLGFNRGTTSQDVYAVDPVDAQKLSNTLSSVTKSDFDQGFGGLYVAANQGNLSYNLQLRRAQTRFDFSDPNFFGTSKSKATLDGTTVTGDVSYARPLSDGLSLIPSAGVGVTRTGDSTLDYADGSQLKTDAHTDTVGYVGATLQKTQQSGAGNGRTNLFATVAAYHDFSSDLTSTYTSPLGTPATIKTANIGTYGKVSVGADYARALKPGAVLGAKQLDASFGVDGRFSSDLHSVGANVQIRLQF